MSNVINIEKAAENLKRLRERHKEFMLELRKHHGQEENPVGSLRFDDDLLSIIVLGVSLDIKHRPVVVDRMMPELIEYVVFTEHESEHVVVFKFYLHLNSCLSRNPDSESKLCDYDNHKIEKILVYEVSEQLLKSPIFRIENKSKSDPLSEKKDSVQSEMQ
jgi:hypothetical protein